jgi:hypothetical protein
VGADTKAGTPKTTKQSRLAFLMCQAIKQPHCLIPSLQGIPLMSAKKRLNYSLGLGQLIVICNTTFWLGCQEKER